MLLKTIRIDTLRENVQQKKHEQNTARYNQFWRETERKVKTCNGLVLLTRFQLPHPILSLYETKQNKLVRQKINL